MKYQKENYLDKLINNKMHKCKAFFQIKKVQKCKTHLSTIICQYANVELIMFQRQKKHCDITLIRIPIFL